MSKSPRHFNPQRLYGPIPHSRSCTPPPPPPPPKDRGADTYAAELVDLTILVGWWFGVGQYAYTIERAMGGRSWGVVRRRTMEVVGEYPAWPVAMREAKRHADARG